MLVLGRKVGERIIVRDSESGEVIQIMLVEIVAREDSASHARLGIEASRRFIIAREEVDRQGLPPAPGGAREDPTLRRAADPPISQPP